MKQLHCLFVRNMILFRKNQTNIWLSIGSVVIIYGLYATFLRDFMIQAVTESGMTAAQVVQFTDCLMTSGLLVVVNTTTCFGMMQLCIRDVELGIRRDFLIAPVPNENILFGYWLSSIVVSFVFTGIANVFVQLYLYQRYDFYLHIQEQGVLLLLLLLCSVINSEILLCFIAFIKDTTTFSTFGNLYGMLAGFLAGTYLPYHLYPERLKQTLYYYPPMHLTSVVRQLFLTSLQQQEPMEQAGIYDTLFQTYGVRLYRDGSMVGIRQQYILLLMSFACMLCFLGVVHNER